MTATAGGRRGGGYEPGMSYREALGSASRRASLPFGYSLGVFSAGQLLANRHGAPQLVDLLLYALGAVAAYTGARAVSSRPAEGPSRPPPRGGAAAVLHAATIAASIVLAALVARVPGGVAWPLGGLVLTAAYLGGSALEDVLPVNRLADMGT